MQYFLALVLVLLYVIWIRWFVMAMVAAKEWPDLVVSLVIAAGSFLYGWAVVWDISITFPTRAMGDLLLPLIKVFYGPWL